MLGGDKSIRSSLGVADVLGAVSADKLSKSIQERCDAGHMMVDASSEIHKSPTVSEHFES